MLQSSVRACGEQSVLVEAGSRNARIGDPSATGRDQYGQCQDDPGKCCANLVSDAIRILVDAFTIHTGHEPPCRSRRSAARGRKRTPQDLTGALANSGNPA